MRRVLAVSLAFLALAACTHGDPRENGGVAEVERPMPTLTDIDTLSGAPLQKNLLSGPVTVVNVWATWCEPCRQEQTAIQAVQARYEPRGVRFLGINYNDDREAAERWVDDFAVTYPSLYDPDGRTAALLGFPFLPDTYVADAGGTIKFVVYGQTDAAELSGLIDRLMPDEGGATSPAPGAAVGY